MQSIPIRHDVTPDAFREIRAAAEPVVLKGAVAHWPVVQAGDAAAYLRSFGGRGEVEYMRAPPEVEGRLHYGATVDTLNFTLDRTRFDAFLDLLAAEAACARPATLVVQGLTADDHAPGFAAANALALLPPVVPPRLWIGNAGKVATHYDPLENIACVAAGKRRFTLFPPEQVANLYMGPFHPTPAGAQVSMVHLTTPHLTRYPRFADALEAAQTAELDPGDAIYIPYHWYHHVEALAPFNLLVNYWWDPAPAGPGSPWDAMMHGLMALRRLPPDQRRAWKAMFAHYVFLENGDPGAHLPPEARGILGATTPRDLARMRDALLARLREG